MVVLCCSMTIPVMYMYLHIQLSSCYCTYHIYLYCTSFSRSRVLAPRWTLAYIIIITLFSCPSFLSSFYLRTCCPSSLSLSPSPIFPFVILIVHSTLISFFVLSVCCSCSPSFLCSKAFPALRNLDQIFILCCYIGHRLPETRYRGPGQRQNTEIDSDEKKKTKKKENVPNLSPDWLRGFPTLTLRVQHTTNNTANTLGW